jgi:acetylornithine/succinyldiaminopimelate/putrescine aminotransferase
MVVIPMLDRHHVLTQVTGSHDAIIRLLPPYVITDDDIRWFTDALNDVLGRVHRVAGPMFGMGRNALRAKVRERHREV